MEINPPNPPSGVIWTSSGYSPPFIIILLNGLDFTSFPLIYTSNVLLLNVTIIFTHFWIFTFSIFKSLAVATGHSTPVFVVVESSESIIIMFPFEQSRVAFSGIE